MTCFYYGLDDRGSITGRGSDEIYSLGPTQNLLPRTPEALNLGVKLPGRAADHSPPSNSIVKTTWNYTSTPPYLFMAWCLVNVFCTETCVCVCVYVCVCVLCA
jgi:hypothetical protein